MFNLDNNITLKSIYLTTLMSAHQDNRVILYVDGQWVCNGWLKDICKIYGVSAEHFNTVSRLLYDITNLVKQSPAIPGTMDKVYINNTYIKHWALKGVSNNPSAGGYLTNYNSAMEKNFYNKKCIISVVHIKKKSVLLEEHISEFKSTDAEQGVDLKHLMLATKLQNMDALIINSDFVKQKTSIEACLEQAKVQIMGLGYSPEIVDKHMERVFAESTAIIASAMSDIDTNLKNQLK